MQIMPMPSDWTAAHTADAAWALAVAVAFRLPSALVHVDRIHPEELPCRDFGIASFAGKPKPKG